MWGNGAGGAGTVSVLGTPLNGALLSQGQGWEEGEAPPGKGAITGKRRNELPQSGEDMS